MTTDVRRVLGLTVMAVLALVVRAGAEERRFPAVTAWSNANGLPARNILAIAQDHDGYLWLGTDGGLIRFDGVRFDSWRTPHELGGRSVWVVMTARDGGLWLGFNDSNTITRIEHGRAVNYEPRDPGGKPGVLAIIEDRSGTLWAGGRNGLRFLRDNGWHAAGEDMGLSPGVEVTSLYEDRRGGLWMGTSLGIFTRAAGASRFVLHDRAALNVQGFGEDRTGAMWVTDPQLIARPLAARERVDVRAGVERPAAGWRMLADRKGALWIAALGEGLMRVVTSDGGRPVMERVRYEHKVAGGARSLFVDREANVWVGLRRGGLVRLSDSAVETTLQLPGLTNDGVRAITAAADGSVWVATGRSVSRFLGGGRRTFDLNRTTALHADRHGRVWALTHEGLRRFEQGRFTSLPALPGISFGWISSFTTDPLDAVWLCSNTQGLLKWQPGAPAESAPVRAVDGRPCSFVHADRRGRVWAGFNAGGVVVFDGDRADAYTTAHGLTPGAILAIHEDPAGSVWMASPTGVSRLRDGVWTTVTSHNGVPSGIVPSFVEDAQGYLWLAVRSGGSVIRISPAEFEKAARHPGHHLDYFQYDEADGLEALLWPSLGRPTAVRGGDGRLWFVSGRGLAVIDPQQVRTRHRVSPPRVERIVANGRELAPRPQLTVASDTSALQVDYTAPSLTSPSTLRFRHMLEGSGSGWIHAGQQRQASYQNLQPGTYRFRVAATTGGGWSEGVPIGVIIPLPFHRTGWFYVSCACAVVAALCAAWWLRLRSVTRTYAIALAERARVSREIHDTLLQGLSGIALELEAVANELDASRGVRGDDVRRVRKRVSRCLNEARRSVSDLRSPALETSDLVGALQEVARKTGDRTALTIDVAASGRRRRPQPHIEQHLLRIGQEAIHNAARHASARHIQVHVVYRPAHVTLRVSDDGCGFEPRDQSPWSGEHWGLTSMKERADKLGGRLTVSSRPSHGTCVEVVVPLSTPDAEAMPA